MNAPLRVLGLAALFAAASVSAALAASVTLTLQESTNGLGNWQTVPVTGGIVTAGGQIKVETASDSAFYRLVAVGASAVLPPDPAVMALIPAGSFQMGDQSGANEGSSGELPVHTVDTGAFYMDRYEVTPVTWNAVADWAQTNNYDIAASSVSSKATNHPVWDVDWYEAVKWCNAKSEKEGLTPCYTVGGLTFRTGASDSVACNFSASGYRLPTEAEWEKAARGGLSGKRFPWGDTITHSQANYYSLGAYGYDVSPTRGYHPSYATGGHPYTSAVGSAPANAYGLYEIIGNVEEWCWDWYDSSYYYGSPTNDPRGPSLGSYRVIRGGSWAIVGSSCRTAARSDYYAPGGSDNRRGFRTARSYAP